MLSAKHCIENIPTKRVRVVLGEYVRSARDPNEETIGVTSITKHSQYDAAILKVLYLTLSAYNLIN